MNLERYVFITIPLLVFAALFALGFRSGWKEDWTFPSYIGILVCCLAAGYFLGAAFRIIKQLF